jgi:hypothetical protein
MFLHQEGGGEGRGIVICRDWIVVIPFGGPDGVQRGTSPML